MHAGELSQGGAAALGRQPLLLPDANPDQRRDHRLEERGPRLPPRVDPPHRRSRRHEGGGGRSRQWLVLARGSGPRRERGAIVPRRPAGGSRRVRRVRRARAHAASRRGGRLVADRALRAGHHAHPRRRLGAALSVGRRRGARVLPARGSRAPRATRRRRSRSCRRTRRRGPRRKRACARSSKSAQSSGPCSTPSPSGRREAATVARGVRVRPDPARRHARAPLSRARAAPERDRRGGPRPVRRRRATSRPSSASWRRATPSRGAPIERGSTATSARCSPSCAGAAARRRTRTTARGRCARAPARRPEGSAMPSGRRPARRPATLATARPTRWSPSSPTAARWPARTARTRGARPRTARS